MVLNDPLVGGFIKEAEDQPDHRDNLLLTPGQGLSTLAVAEGKIALPAPVLYLICE